MITVSTRECAGFGSAMFAMHNSYSNWEKSDTEGDKVGPNDIALSNRLGNAGDSHGKHLRQIYVWCDITAPFYWWKEFETYRFGTEKVSTSTMHNISDREFSMDDFSHEHLLNLVEKGDDKHFISPLDALDELVDTLNIVRSKYLETKKKVYWWQMIQLLPNSYNQMRTYAISYQTLRRMYRERKNHKLDEWKNFCKWIESLPYSELITE